MKSIARLFMRGSLAFVLVVCCAIVLLVPEAQASARTVSSQTPPKITYRVSIQSRLQSISWQEFERQKPSKKPPANDICLAATDFSSVQSHTQFTLQLFVHNFCGITAYQVGQWVGFTAYCGNQIFYPTPFFNNLGSLANGAYNGVKVVFHASCTQYCNGVPCGYPSYEIVGDYFAHGIIDRNVVVDSYDDYIELSMP